MATVNYDVKFEFISGFEYEFKRMMICFIAKFMKNS